MNVLWSEMWTKFNPLSWANVAITSLTTWILLVVVAPKVADLAMVWVADAALLPIVMTARMWVRCLGYLKYRWSL